MWRFRRETSAVVAIVVLGAAAAGGVVAATTQSSDERALPTRQAADPGIERQVNRLLAPMTLEEN